MRQQGISQYENNNMVPVDSPKDQTPVRTKNHYTPVHSNHGNHGHYGKENLLHGGPEMHDFISSGFVTLGRGHLKAQHSVDDISWQGDLDLPLSYGNHHHDYQHSHMDLTAFTPKPDRPQRMNNILTAATEPYDVSLSRSFQNLSLDLKPDLNDKDLDDYYPRKHHHQDFHGSSHLAPHGPSHNMHSSSHTLHTSSHNNPHGSSHMLKVGVESSSHQQRQRPRGRVQRAMSQDHVLSPPRTPRRDRERDRDRDSYGLSPYGAMATAAYGSSRNLSSEQLLSVERLQSKDPLLSPVARRDKFRQKAMSRAMSHADMLLPTTPQHERHDRRDHERRDHERRDHERRDHNHRPKLQTQLTVADAYSTMTGNHLQASSAKRNAFASRRTHTVDHMSYMSGQAYRSGSKNEVTV